MNPFTFVALMALVGFGAMLYFSVSSILESRRYRRDGQHGWARHMKSNAVQEAVIAGLLLGAAWVFTWIGP